MAEETLYCPSCHQRVRVPEEMLGQPVQCPLCRLVFTAPTRAGSGTPPSVALPAAPGAPHGSGWPAPPQPAWQAPQPGLGASGSVRGPAIGLLIVGIFGSLVSLAGLALFIYLLSAGQAATDQLASAYPPGPLQDWIRNAYSPAQNRMNLAFQVIFAVMNVVILAAAVQMLRVRTFWLAVVGSVLAIVNINSLCCCLGAPIGIWSLIVLFQPGVMSAFKERSGPFAEL